MRNNESEFVTVKEIVKMSKNLTTQKVMTIINNRLLRGTHIKEDGKYYVPRNIAKDYAFIVDNPQLIRLAVLKRAYDVCDDYNTNFVQICKSADLDSSVLSKVKLDEDYALTYKTIYKLCQGPVGLHCRIDSLVDIAKNKIKYNDIRFNKNINVTRKNKSNTTKNDEDREFKESLEKELFDINANIDSLFRSIDDIKEIIEMLKVTKKDDKKRLKEWNDEEK